MTVQHVTQVLPSQAPELARRILMRRRLLQFIKQTYPNYEAGWVHEDICARLERFSQQVADKKSPRLMLLVPPRHGKSEIASIRFPAWHLGQYPAHELVNAGYNLDLPSKFSRKVREIMRLKEYLAVFPEAELDPDSQGIESWLTKKGGGFTAVGVGGGLTGKGAHILIVDDPIKNQEEADNILTRDKLWDWYQSTALTRLAPGGGVLVIETWWNDDDLAGRIQQLATTEEGADQFEIVKYPAIAEEFEYKSPTTLEIRRSAQELRSDELPAEFVLLRRPGQALHPARYDEKALNRMKSNLARRIWSALYQQNPVPEEGVYFNKSDFRYYPGKVETDAGRIFIAWDFAIGEKQTNDYTVGVALMQDSNDVLYMLDMVRIKADAFAIVNAVLDLALKYPQKQVTMGFEDGQIFKSIEPMLKRRMQERGFFPSYEVLKPLTDKLVRARPLQGRVQHQRLYFPTDAPWLSTVEREFLRFPAGAHDDIIDAASWAVQLTLVHQPPHKVEFKRPVTWKEKLTSLILGGSDSGSHMSA